MAEQDKVNNTVIFTAVIVTAALLIAMVAGTARLFDLTMREEIERKVLAVENTQLRQLRVDEQRRLNSYKWVDQKAGVVRVPVDRAVELIVSEGYKRPPPVAAPPAPPATAPAASPATAPVPAVAAPAPSAAPAPAPATGGAH